MRHRPPRCALRRRLRYAVSVMLMAQRFAMARPGQASQLQRYPATLIDTVSADARRCS